MNHVQAFIEDMQRNGINVGVDIRDDGEIHRRHIEGDKRGSLNGWFVLHSDGLPAGAYGDWKEGITYNWCEKESHQLTAQERLFNQQRIEQAKERRKQEVQRLQSQAAKEASELFLKASPSVGSNHPYLKAKRINAHGVRHVGSR